MAGLAEQDGDRAGAGGTKSSPWSERQGGALNPGVLRELGEEATVTGDSNLSRPGIGDVGFRAETITTPSLDHDTDDDVFGDETVVSPVVQSRPRPDGRTKKTGPANEPWHDVADAAEGPANRRFDHPDGPTQVPLTVPATKPRAPEKRAETDAALEELRTWAEKRRRSRSGVTSPEDTGDIERSTGDLPSFRPPPKRRPGPPAPSVVEPPPRRARPQINAPSTRPAPKPAATHTERPKRRAPEARRAPSPQRQPKPAGPRRAPSPKKPTAEPRDRARTTPPPQPSYPSPPPPAKPRGLTRSLVDRPKTAPVMPKNLGEEPSSEHTKLGQLAQPEDDLLMAMPVMHSEPPRERTPPSPHETIAAPGELAGFNDGGLPRSLSGLVSDLDTPSQASVDHRPPVLQTQSEVRRGLAGHLAEPAPTKPVPIDDRAAKSKRLREVDQEPTAQEDDEPRARRVADTLPPQPDVRGLDLDDAPTFGAEETAAMLDGLVDDSLSDIPPLVEPAPMEPTADGDDLFVLDEAAAVEVTSEFVDPTEGVRRVLASGWRRAGAVTIDALLIAALVVAPSLLGLFGDAIVNASIVDPDDMGALAVSGELTLPIVFGAVLYFVYSGLSHALGARTLGKLLLGLEVVATGSGERISPLRAFVRAALGLFGLLLGGLGYFWLFVDRRQRALHDHLARTTVVRTIRSAHRSAP